MYRSGKHLQNQAFARYTCTCTEAYRDLYQEPLAFACGERGASAPPFAPSPSPGSAVYRFTRAAGRAWRSPGLRRYGAFSGTLLSCSEPFAASFRNNAA